MRKHIRKVFLMLVFALILSGSMAQNFERFSNKEGFNQNTINDITKDKYGFLWIGTPNGLIKYDGYEFETYTTQSKTNGNISSNHITCLHNDLKGMMWLGSDVGVNLYIPWQEKFYTIPLPSKLEVTQIVSGPDGNIWFAGENKLFSCKVTSTERGEMILSENLLAEHIDIGNINDFNFLEEDVLIFATDSGLKKIDFLDDTIRQNSIIKGVVNFEKFANTEIKCIKKIKNFLWVGTNEALYKTTLDDNRVYLIKKVEQSNDLRLSFSGLNVNTIFEAHNGDIWIGTTNNGLLKYLEKEDRFLNYRYDPKNNLGLSSSFINTIFQDSYDVLWIGTAQGGINKLDVSQKQFFNYSKNPYDHQAIPDNLITSILEDREGQVWVSVYNSNDLIRSTTKVDQKTVGNLKFENLSDKIPFPIENTIRRIFEDRMGFIWVCTDANIIVYNPVSGSFKNVSFNHEGEILPAQAYRDILHLDDHKLIIVGDEIKIIENPWANLQRPRLPRLDVLSRTDLDPKVLCITVIQDSKNNLWFATNKGLLYASRNEDHISIDGALTDDENEELRLSYSNVFSVHEDHEGNIWAGTFGGGLNQITLDQSGKPIQIDYHRKNDVLPDDAIYGIIQQDETYLWLSTDMGLVKFNMKTNENDVFDVRDGLVHNNFRQGSYFSGKSAYYYFGGLNGLTIFRPESIKKDTIPPKILITSLFINNKEVEIGEERNKKTILEKSISESEKISISQDEQSIAFQVVVNHTATPSKNKIAYQLEGFNDDWIESESGKSTITYTNLSAGDYTLKIKAANGDGVWSDEVKKLDLKILPPWYQTWWSYVLFIALALLLISGILLYFIQHEKLKQKLIYEQIDKERIDTINQGKFRYFTNISHEFRTPLTLISGPLEEIISINKDETQARYLAIIQKNTKRLLSLANQLITFRQAEKGFINLNLNKITLGNFLYPTTEAFENYAREKSINFYYKVNSPNEELVIDVEKVERILFNLLSNAFKNTPPLGSISIEADVVHKNGKDHMKFDVVDSGKGIPEKDLGNIFERFYQLGSSNDCNAGGGIGLAFCKSILDIFNGEILVTSEPNVETRFSVLIPTKPDNSFHLSEIGTVNRSYVKDWVPLPSNFKSEIIAETKEPATHKPTILIVEDEEDLQIFLQNFLSEKYKIMVGENGIEGLQKVNEHEPDLVISDIMMPEMNGFVLCEKIKANPKTCHIPVLLLTALSDEKNMIKGLEFGADEYISKPFSVKHLVLRIEKLVQNNIKLKEHFSKSSTIPKEGIEMSKKDTSFLNDINEAINENMANSGFGVEELSTKLGLSTSHFYRRLKQLTGQVPNVYLRNFRLQHAAKLLKSNEGYNVAEVMYQIGIESKSYFSKSFKKLHGVSPSEFLKKNVRNGDSNVA